ncbi:MAG TPA: ABC-type transport auxiliary lipoprotein family protein [Methylocystis sp.]|nr:ABC-type transport auxiliary lipoprotein family protein [Methylocystis sp.]
MFVKLMFCGRDRIWDGARGGMYAVRLTQRGGLYAAATAICAALALSGCANPRETFDLSPETLAPGRAHGAAIAVHEPNASAFIDTNRFVIRGEGGELAYLADAQWTDTVPRLVQGRLIDRLSAHGVNAVRPGDGAAYRLSMELRRFEIDSGSERAVVEIVARVTNEKDGARVTEKVILGEAPAPHTLGPEAARAYEAALDAAADRLGSWLRRGR